MTEKYNKEEEVDLLVIFSLIGKKINNLMIFLINLIINILNLFFKTVYFIKKKILILTISIVIGGFLGFIYQSYFSAPTYVTSMTLRPNFNSTIQLYKNIEFYQSLIEQKDYVKLEEHLNINHTEAQSLEEFSVQPYKSESMKLITFKNMLHLADSNTAAKLSYEEFTDKIAFENFSNHIITLKLKKREVPTQLTSSIVKSIVNNNYYANIQDTYIENLKIKRESINLSIQKLDSLLFFYKQKSQEETKKENAGTNIYMADNNNQSIEVELFGKYSSFNEQLIEINEDLNDKFNIVNIVSSFTQTGKLENNFGKLSLFFSALICFLITFCLLILIEVNKILVTNSKIEIKKLSLIK